MRGLGRDLRKLFREMAGLRVVVAEDDVLLREGIASLLDGAGFDVVGQAGDAAALDEIVHEQLPDLAVIDIRMPPTQTWEGLDAARSIRTEFPEIGILLLSAHVEIETAIDLLEGGRRISYLLKSRVLQVADVVDTLRESPTAAPSSIRLWSRAGHAASPERSPRRADAPRARARALDGRRPFEQRHRGPPVRHRGRRREARPQHPREAPPACNAGRAPSRARLIFLAAR